MTFSKPILFGHNSYLLIIIPYTRIEFRNVKIDSWKFATSHLPSIIHFNAIIQHEYQILLYNLTYIIFLKKPTFIFMLIINNKIKLLVFYRNNIVYEV